MEEFENKGPFTDTVSIADAMSFISYVREELEQLQLTEASIRKGLNIFKIDQPPSHLILTMEKVSTVDLEIISPFNCLPSYFRH